MRLKSLSFPVVIYLACFYYWKMYRLKHSVLDFCYGGVIYYKNPVFCWTVKTLFLVVNQCILRRYNNTSKKKNMLRFYCNPWRWMEFRFKSFKYCLIFCNFAHFAWVTFKSRCVLREGPIEITGGEVNNFWCRHFFKSYLCPWIFFSVARIFFRHNRL